ncbi:MAG: T9SS type A sorting domain-containing protein [Ignavibacteria bacterium]|nr:T9SS type A sorting domain-containing protein [Ignavibacteria bacterium]
MKIYSTLVMLVVLCAISFFGSDMYAGKQKFKKHKTKRTVQKVSTAMLFPSPTEIPPFHKEGRKRLSRKDWIDTLHRAAPNVDWRKIEEQNRIVMSAIRSARAKSNEENTLSSQGLQKIANGQLHGYWWERGSADQSGSAAAAEYDLKTDTIISRSASGNIWKATLEGNNWKVIDDEQRLDYRLRVVVDNKDRLLRWSGQSPQYSDDWGKTWKNASPLTGLTESQEKYKWGWIEKTARTKDAVYLLTREWNGSPWGAKWALYRSMDFGKNYTFVFSTMDDLSLWTNNEFSVSAYYTTKGAVYKLGNSGNGTLLSNLPAQNAQISGGFDDGKSLYLYAYSDGTLYKSNNGAKSWSNQGKTADGNITFVSRTDHNLITCGWVDCYRSNDGGKTWNVMNRWGEYYGQPATKLHADIMQINSFFNKAGKEVILICCHGGLYVSYDQLQTVNNLSLKKHNISQYYSTMTSYHQPDIMYAGSQDQGYQRSEIDTNTGILNFQQVISGDYGHMVSSDSGRTFWMTYPGFLTYLPEPRKGGLSAWWDYTSKGQLWMAPLMADPDNPAAVFMCGGVPENEKGGKLYHITSVNGKAEAKVLPFNFGSQITAANYSPKNKKIRFVLTSNKDFYTSMDGGKTWQSKSEDTLPGGHYFYGNGILPSPINEKRVYVCGSGYSNPGVYRSEDYGATWTPLTENAPRTLFYRIVCTPDEKYIFAATESGPYVYVVEENKWYDMYGPKPGGAPDQTYWSVEYVEPINVVRFCTYGRGVWDFEIADYTPSVKVKLRGKMTDFCENQPLEFTAQPIQAGKKPTYIWKVNGKEIIRSNKVTTFLRLRTGDRVTCEIVSSSNQKTSVSQPITMQLRPSVEIAVTSETVIAASGVPTTVIAKSKGVLNKPKYRWIINGDTVKKTAETINDIQFKHGDKIQCDYYSENECTSPTVSSFTVGIADFSHSVIAVNIPIQFTNKTPYFESVNWDFGDGTSSSLEKPFKVFTQPGEYTITLTVQPGNTFRTEKVIVGGATTIPYSNNFDKNDGGFRNVSLSGDGLDSWMWGKNEKGKKFMNDKSGTIAGEKSWITNIGRGQGTTGNMYALETPPFSFIGAEGEYYLGFSYRQMTGDGGGFNVQYSLDKGVTWQVLGKKDDPSGSDWYNADNLWSLEGPGFNNFSMDIHKPRIKISQFVGKDDVRFRFTNGTILTDEDGVMIDDFAIEGKSTGIASPVENTISSTFDNIGPSKKVDFYSSTGKIIATIKNLGDNNIGKITVQILKAGEGVFTHVTDKRSFAQKVFYIQGDTSTNNRIEMQLYFTESEINGWEKMSGKSKSTLGIISSADTTISVSQLSDISMPSNNTVFGNDYVVKGTVNGTINGTYVVSNSALMTSIAETDRVEEQLVYPNPTTDRIFVIDPSTHTIEVLDVAGKVVAVIAVEGGSVSLSGLPSGTYVLQMISDSATKVVRITKQ